LSAGWIDTTTQVYRDGEQKVGEMSVGILSLMMSNVHMAREAGQRKKVTNLGSVPDFAVKFEGMVNDHFWLSTGWQAPRMESFGLYYSVDAYESKPTTVNRMLESDGYEKNIASNFAVDLLGQNYNMFDFPVWLRPIPSYGDALHDTVDVYGNDSEFHPSDAAAVGGYRAAVNNNRNAISRVNRLLVNRKCRVCDKKADYSCGRCNGVSYCTDSCALVDWDRSHGHECRP
jgi:hypothetical protein